MLWKIIILLMFFWIKINSEFCFVEIDAELDFVVFCYNFKLIIINNLIDHIIL